MTIVNDDSSIISVLSFFLIDDARGIIYDRHMFIIEATRAYQVEHEKGTPFRWAPSRSHRHYTRLGKDKQSSLIETFVNYSRNFLLHLPQGSGAN